MFFRKMHPATKMHIMIISFKGESKKRWIEDKKEKGYKKQRARNKENGDAGMLAL